jgi:hypothetical protein
LLAKGEKPAPWEIEVQAEHDALQEAQRRTAQARKPHYSGTNVSAYNDKAVRDELEILRTKTEARNPQCNISALKLARLPGIDRNWLREQLVDAMHANGSVRENGMYGVQATIDSAFAKADKDGPRVI